jgi:uncharacterized protein involved in oxidation of intracellular sulfur
MRVLLIVNEAPYGSERLYNALRLALALQTREPAAAVTVFLMADAVTAGRAGQKTPDGYYNIERMLRRLLAGRGDVLLCGVCMDARALGEADLVPGLRRSSMDELAAATAAADKVLVF